jgi:hypothetical protein
MHYPGVRGCTCERSYGSRNRGAGGTLAALPDGPGRPALDAALAAYVGATSHGAVTRTDLLTVIDSALFSRNLKQIPIDYRLAHFSCSSSGKVNTA